MPGVHLDEADAWELLTPDKRREEFFNMHKRIAELEAESLLLKARTRALIDASVMLAGKYEVAMAVWKDKLSAEMIDGMVQDRERLFAACRFLVDIGI